MLHAKIQPHRTSGFREDFEGFTIYRHGGHFGHVTNTIFINLCPLFPRRLHIKIGFDWSKRCLKMMVIYMYIASGQG